MTIDETPVVDAAALSAEAVRAATDMTVERLDNGLQLVIVEDHRLPIAAVDLNYHVGSRREEPGATGLAHLFEHLMFEGSANVAPGEHMALMRRLGAAHNASTSPDVTHYFEVVPEHGVELALWLEADRMGALRQALTQDRLDVQRGIVRNERYQRYENPPYGTQLETVLSLMFPEGHPYRHPTIGSMEELAAATLDDVAAFHERWYAPSNASLVVAGDVDRAQVREWVAQFFGGIPDGPGTPEEGDLSLPLDLGGPTRLVRREDVPAPRLVLAWRAPSGNEAAEALRLGIINLTQGRGARVTNRLVRELEVASSVSIGGIGLDRDVDVLMATATPRDGVSLDDLERELVATIRSLVDEPITDRERDRLLPAAAAGVRSLRQQVSTLAHIVNAGVTSKNDAWHFTGAYERLAAITPEAVASVVDTIVTEANCAVLTYEPA